ncbi:putative RNA recognition motif (a k a RRM RBD or RNP domain) [Trypanosoma vivax]|nr:hypothetical protein TRVL_05454 [Trypanosoma vivax]KAH8619656.1 putative RNA recognition motif (a k a RRM RBD or RNP domain) [Trypanosoma vivax]
MSGYTSTKSPLRNFLEQLRTLSNGQGCSGEYNSVIDGVPGPVNVSSPFASVLHFGGVESSISEKPLHREGSGYDMSSSVSYGSNNNVLTSSLPSATCATMHSTVATNVSMHSTVVGAVEPRGETHSRTNLFISNIPHTMEKSELLSLFSVYGEILSAAIMRNIHTGDSLGTAFVRFATTENARAALNSVNGKRVDGRALSVQWAKRQHDGTPVGEARAKIMKLFVRNIPLEVTNADLVQMFTQYGPVKSVSIHKDTAPDTEKCQERCIAFVTFSAEGVAEKAAEAVHNTRPFPSCGSVPLMVKLAEDNPKNSHGNGTKNSTKNRNRKGLRRGTEHVVDPSLRHLVNAPLRDMFSAGGGASSVPHVFPVGADGCALSRSGYAVYPAIVQRNEFVAPDRFATVGVGRRQAFSVPSVHMWAPETMMPININRNGVHNDVLLTTSTNRAQVVDLKTTATGVNCTPAFQSSNGCEFSELSTHSSLFHSVPTCSFAEVRGDDPTSPQPEFAPEANVVAGSAEHLNTDNQSFLPNDEGDEDVLGFLDDVDLFESGPSTDDTFAAVSKLLASLNS